MNFVTSGRATELLVIGPPGQVPKFGCSKLWMATKGAGTARIRTKMGANFIVRCGDSEYEGPKVDFGLRDTECHHFEFCVFADLPKDFKREEFQEPREVRA